VTLTAQDVAEITRLLEDSQFDELHLEQDGLKLTLKRGAPASSATLACAAGPAGAGAEPPRGEYSLTGIDRSTLNVTAPLVGIFYRAPKPGAPPYVEVGSPVEEDTIIGIIEVMKLMNAVRAEVRGTVVEVLVQDGAVVEYGRVLLRITRGAPGG
jgi:acetyl-CoA carboxylase biotin carboxyl carrier protein